MFANPSARIRRPIYVAALPIPGFGPRQLRVRLVGPVLEEGGEQFDDGEEERVLEHGIRHIVVENVRSRLDTGRQCVATPFSGLSRCGQCRHDRSPVGGGDARRLGLVKGEGIVTYFDMLQSADISYGNRYQFVGMGKCGWAMAGLFTLAEWRIRALRNLDAEAQRAFTQRYEGR